MYHALINNPNDIEFIIKQTFIIQLNFLNVTANNILINIRKIPIPKNAHLLSHSPNLNKYALKEDNKKNKIDIIDTKVIFFILSAPFILFLYQISIATTINSTLHNYNSTLH